MKLRRMDCQFSSGKLYQAGSFYMDYVVWFEATLQLTGTYCKCLSGDHGHRDTIDLLQSSDACQQCGLLRSSDGRHSSRSWVERNGSSCVRDATSASADSACVCPIQAIERSLCFPESHVKVAVSYLGGLCYRQRIFRVLRVFRVYGRMKPL